MRRQVTQAEQPSFLGFDEQPDSDEHPPGDASHFFLHFFVF